jgi:protein-S-isoprenylcysteine O-methyltransferase Ste14
MIERSDREQPVGGTPEPATRRSAGVHLPPPLVYLGAILLGVAVDRFIPLRVLPDVVASWVGGAFVLSAVILNGLGMREFRRAGTTVRPDRATSALVTTGPFRFSRNPFYLALALLQTGIGIWMNSAWVVALVVPAVAIISRAVIPREERYLTEIFGQAYRDYQTSVRRWL